MLWVFVLLCQNTENKLIFKHIFLDLIVDVPGHGKVVVDIAYGGAFYALVSAEKLGGLDVYSAKMRDLVDAASAVTEAVKVQVSPVAAFITNTSLCAWRNINHHVCEGIKYLYI
jgi:proline racemase